MVSGTEGHAVQTAGKLLIKANQLEGADGGEWSELPEPWPHALALWFDAINGKDAPLVGVREAADRSAVMEALYQAAQHRTWVAPAYQG
jgi:predicted dehydrogenase